MVRAFLAIEIAPDTRNRITAMIERLKPRIAGVSWVAPHNFHLTLKFLGDIDESDIEPIGAVLTDALRPFPRCIINAKGLGVFPGLRRPRVLWVGLDGQPLIALAAKVEEAVTGLGFAPEERPFRPHLTIGRVRHANRIERTIEQELRHWTEHEFGASPVGEVILFKSDLGSGGARYTRLRVIALQT